MRRFRRRRRRLAALLLPGLAALVSTTTISLGAETAPTTTELQPSKHAVTIGGHLKLRGSFPDSPNAEIEIRSRRRGSDAWRLEKGSHTDGAGHFSERVRPRATGRWRAELTGDPAALGAAVTERQTPDASVRVRSRTRAGVSARNVVRGHSVHIRGRVLPAGARRRVVIHAGGKRLATRAGRDGRFSRTWRPGGVGTYRVSVRARGNRLASGSHDGAGKVQVFRPAQASWYGPGLYGGRTACGQTLSSSTLGVANKSMPCGTRVTLRYNGREVTVPVIDRGPYVAGREYDLTAATKNRLGFGSTGTVLSSR